MKKHKTVVMQYTLLENKLLRPVYNLTFSQATLVNSRLLMTIVLAKLWSILLAASTNAVSSLPVSMSPSVTLKSGPMTYFHPDSLGNHLLSTTVLH